MWFVEWSYVFAVVRIVAYQHTVAYQHKAGPYLSKSTWTKGLKGKVYLRVSDKLSTANLSVIEKNDRT